MTTFTDLVCDLPFVVTFTFCVPVFVALTFIFRVIVFLAGTFLTVQV
ncbi:MAG: hypothetical protein ISP01_05850 [Methanobrevibacter arboriphilus]|uniref:Transmembrane protein n=1 Tax=Methanobrevibacter arboriphilus TaxID=39441 RepID=A0A843AD33_METAZ|nr:hypothetical protein [Methanobrevibacter arboriphilus]